MEMVVLKDEERIFYQYKIHVELNQQFSIFDVDNALTSRERKNRAVRRTFDFIKEQDSYIEFKSSGKDISVIKFQLLSDEILVMKLAKKKSVELTTKETTTFVEKKQDDYPVALVLFDAENQTIYVERAYKLYTDPKAMIHILQNMFVYINSQISENQNGKFYIKLITSEEGFMECFNSFSVVNKITLKVDSPNSFLGNREADDVLNELRDETRTQQSTFEFNSDEGIDGDGFYRHFQSFIEYVSRGGGSYSMRGYTENSTKPTSKKSSNKIKTLNITVNFNINQDRVENAEELASKISKTNHYEEEDEENS